MKPRILNYGSVATHQSITNLSKITEPVAISDYDAFVLDPKYFSEDSRKLCNTGGPARFRADTGSHGHELGEAVIRRRAEVADLLTRKGGVVLCFVRPRALSFVAIHQGGHQTNFHEYEFLSGLRTSSGPVPWSEIVGGSGTSISMVAGGQGVAVEYLRILRGHLRFDAFFRCTREDLEKQGATLAVNSVGHPVAAEFRVGPGIVSFIPLPQDVPGERVGAAVVQTVRSFFAGDVELEEPEWARNLPIPGAESHDEEIVRLQGEYEHLRERIASLESERQQLLDYIEAEAQEGKNHKGLLVGNGFRLHPTDSAERRSQFTQHVLNGAQRNQFCLVPTTELFKAVCAVLERQTDGQLKKDIRDSFFSTTGPWTFAR